MGNISESCILSFQFYAGSNLRVINTIVPTFKKSSEKAFGQ